MAVNEGPGSADEAAAPPSQPEKPYHSKRPHRKSRTGCKNCKTRKVKCDEARPVCRACRLRREECVYPVASPSPPPSSPQSPMIPSRGHTPIANLDEMGPMHMWDEPMFRLPDMDELDARLLWFYTNKTFESFSVQAGRDEVIDHILTVKVVQYAVDNPFLMDTLLALSALHLQHMRQPVDGMRVSSYRVRAFEGYRRAIEAARPQTYPALLATSLLLCALSAQMFRDQDAKPLFIVDWMIVWRGIGLIIDLIAMRTLYDGGLTPLFNRPYIDLNSSALHIPGSLLFMVTSIKDGDTDFPNIQTYYSTLKYIGALYKELERGFSPILELRIITLFTFLPNGFVELARQRRPRTLIILAHYLAFAKFVDHVWWMDGISNREIEAIAAHLGDEWADLMRVPLMATRVRSKPALARLMLGNHAWEPPAEDKFEESRDARVRALTLVDDEGVAVDICGKGIYRVPDRTGAPKWNQAFTMPRTDEGEQPLQSSQQQQQPQQ